MKYAWLKNSYLSAPTILSLYRVLVLNITTTSKKIVLSVTCNLVEKLSHYLNFVTFLGEVGNRRRQKYQRCVC